ncbi:MAG: acyltransferase [Thermoguttaceae bacterium]|nr:acyltransferase [Thermoguttaceae bacterium]
MSSFYSEAELAELGLKSYGKDVKISRKCSIYSPEKVSVGNHVRIDDFCILSGDITFGNFTRVGAYSALFGGAGITLKDFSTISVRCSLFSVSDDYSGDFLVGPQINENYTNVKRGPIVLNRFVNIGSGCIVLPGVEFGEGTAIGAASLVRHNTLEWSIYWGNPCKLQRERSNGMVLLANKILENNE